MYARNTSLSAIILGIGLGFISFSAYELFYSKIIEKNKNVLPDTKIDNFDKYIFVNKYNTPLSVLIGLSLAYIGISILSGSIGMIMFGFGVSTVSNINRSIYGAEKNPLF